MNIVPVLRSLYRAFPDAILTKYRSSKVKIRIHFWLSSVSHHNINKCIYTLANPFGVKLYNTAPDTSNFTVTIHTENLDCSDPHIHVYGDHTRTQSGISSIENLNHFIGNFRHLNYEESKSESHKCVYQSIPGEYWPYVFVKITKFSAENSFVCEVQFKDSQ